MLIKSNEHHPARITLPDIPKTLDDTVHETAKHKDKRFKPHDLVFTLSSHK